MTDKSLYTSVAKLGDFFSNEKLPLSASTSNADMLAEGKLLVGAPRSSKTRSQSWLEEQGWYGIYFARK